MPVAVTRDSAVTLLKHNDPKSTSIFNLQFFDKN